MSAVAERTSATTSLNGILTGGNYLDGIVFGASANQIRLFGNSGSNVATITGTFNDNAPHAIQALFNGALGAGYVDGTSVTGLKAGATGLSTSQLSIARNPNADDLHGFFFEGGLFAGDQSASFSTMNSNQRAYWGF